jgi:hypothetical protein
MPTDRYALAALIMAAMEQPSMAGYRLPKGPSDLAYAVADVVLPVLRAAEAREARLREALRAIVACDYRGNQPPEQRIAYIALHPEATDD